MSHFVSPGLKRINLDGPTPTGEPRIQIVDRNHTHRYKTASRKTKDLIHGVKPEEDIVKVLVIALSAWEFYGPNRNGDGFCEKPTKINGEWAVKPDEILPKHHHTFEDTAHVYKHHVNQDPEKSIGPVYDSVYNWHMHRVEVLQGINVNEAERLIDKINGGDLPPVSMGCRIDYDVCTICGNRAPRMSDYCKHVSGDDPSYGMNSLMDDGRRCCVLNPAPHFFDMSYVLEPADEIGHTVKVVARPGECKTGERQKEASSQNESSIYVPVNFTKEANSKRADLDKVSEMDKVIKGQIADVQDNQVSDQNLESIQRVKKDVAPKVVGQAECFPDDLMSFLSNYKPEKVFASLNASGIIPTPGEIFGILSHRKGIQPPKKAIRIINVSTQPLTKLLKKRPDGVSEAESYLQKCLDEENVDAGIVEKLGSYREKRGLYEDYLMREHVPEEVGVPVSQMTGISSPEDAYYEGAKETLHFTDPATGRTYQTTQRAAERADWENKKKLLAETAGTAGALGLGYKTLTANNKMKWLSPLLLGGAAYGGKKIYEQQQVPDVITNEGVEVPGNTEFVSKTGSRDKIGGTILHPIIASQDYIVTDPSPKEMKKSAAVGKKVQQEIEDGASAQQILSKWGKEVVSQK